MFSSRTKRILNLAVNKNHIGETECQEVQAAQLHTGKENPSANNLEENVWILPLENVAQSPSFDHPSHSKSIITSNTEVDNLIGPQLYTFQDNNTQQQIDMEEFIQASTIQTLNFAEDNNDGTNFSITLLSGSGSTIFNDQVQRETHTPGQCMPSDLHQEPTIMEEVVQTSTIESLTSVEDNNIKNYTITLLSADDSTTFNRQQQLETYTPQQLMTSALQQEPIFIEEIVQTNAAEDNTSTNYTLTLFTGNGISANNGQVQSKAHTSQELTDLLHPSTGELEENDSDFEPTSGNDSDDSQQQEESLEEIEIALDNNQDELETVDHGDMTHGRKRLLTADPTEWRKNKTKKLRMLGKPYVGYSRSKDGAVKHDKLRKGRSLLPSCASQECLRSKTRNCSQISEEDRRIIFNKFWRDMNWDQRKVFVTNHVHKSNPKRIYTKNAESRRNHSLQYHLTLNNKKLQVCKKMFLATLNLSEYSVHSWIKSGKRGMNTSRETNTANRERQNNLVRVHEDKKKYLTDFFNSLPKLPSHYGRRDSSKLYLENTVQSKAQLLKVYIKKCTEEAKTPLSRPTFNQIFHEMNLSIHQIKKDKCDVCTQHEVGSLSEEIWNAHMLKKNRPRTEKTLDKEAAKEGKCKLLTMDLQAVKVAPCLQASTVFFKTKLTCHNFTVYDLVSHHVKCFWFTETKADLTASTFVTCIIEYLTSHCTSNEKIPIIIVSDGCTYQNRNNVLANALLSFAVDNQTVITQKFLEPGHTQMECDSLHSCIERKLKGREIHLPSDYLSVTREARLKPFPYEATMMEFHQFKDYNIKALHRYSTIRPGKVANDPVVTDIKALQYSPEGRIFFKLHFDEEWRELPHRPKIVPGGGTAWPPLFKKQRKISLQKWKHLQELKKVLPKDCHYFYDLLPHEAE